MSEEKALPSWAHACDVLVSLLAVLWLIVVMSDGFHLTIGGVRLLSIHSGWRLLFWAGLLVTVRHLAAPRPSLTRRLRTDLPALLATKRVAIGGGAYAGVALLFLFAISRYYRHDVGFTELVDFGDEFANTALPAVRNTPHFVHVDSSGYDGQFYAQLAFDPLLRDPASRIALDTAAFRARRILFSWTAYLVGGGRPYWILQVYAGQNIACWLLLALVLTHWFPPGRLHTFCGWFACLFSAGLILSVRRSLTDGPSMLLIALALLAFERNRHWLASVVLGISGLGRETNVLAGVMLASPGRWSWPSLVRLAAFASIVAIPLLLWMQYVHAVYQAYDTGIGAFGVPLTGYLRSWRATTIELGSSGWWGPARHSLYALVSLTVEVVYLVWRRRWRDPWWRIGVVYALLMALVGPAVWNGYPTAATRASLPLTFAFNVLILDDKWFWLLWLPGNLTILSGLAMIDLWLPANFL
jgi:hypothetical protein